MEQHTTVPSTSIVPNENEYYQSRVALMKSLKAQGINPYVHTFNPTCTFEQYATKYAYAEPNAEYLDTRDNVAGRVMLIRDSSKKLKFYTLQDDQCTLQIILNFKYYTFDEHMSDQEKLEHFMKTASAICRGDIIGIEDGIAYRTKQGQLSIIARSLKILTPCMHLVPMSHSGIKDEELKQRKRYLQFIVNPEDKKSFLMRTRVIKFLRNYLDNHKDGEFLEVQTPILSNLVGGANARPFTTFHNDLDMNMVLRIAPELYLKQLIIAGYARNVYEIGPQFRNEGIDKSHNPEFISLEFYKSYADYNNMMEMAEEIYSSMAQKFHGGYKVMCKPFEGDTPVEIDFAPPFRRIDFVGEIEKCTGRTLPPDFSTQDANNFLDALCKEFDIECRHPRTTPRLLDKLAGHFIEPQCTNPTFVINHPLIMSPLAKWHRDNPNLTERFELFIMGYEFSNAYTELNDPLVQRQTFENQMKDKASGDLEAQPIDETFINALEFGLPPTAGFGLGIDRTAMLFGNVSKIQDVILFPTMKPVEHK
jgi:lysyl-tRNA synthetase class 2